MKWRTWNGRRLGFWPLYPLAAIAAIPFFVGQALYEKRKAVGVALMLVELSTFTMELATMSVQPPANLRGDAKVSMDIQDNGLPLLMKDRPPSCLS